MGILGDIIPSAIMAASLVFAAISLRKKLVQNSRLSTIACLLSDQQIRDEYKSLLMDLRFTVYTFHVYPTMEVNDLWTKLAWEDSEKTNFLGQMLRFMHLALEVTKEDPEDPSLTSGNKYLRERYKDLYNAVKDEHLPENVFIKANYAQISRFISDIVAYLPLRIIRGGFLALFSVSKETMSRLEPLLLKFQDKNLLIGKISKEDGMRLKEAAKKVENEIKVFLLGEWDIPKRRYCSGAIQQFLPLCDKPPVDSVVN